ncbi:TlpA family protein disulfide reductase [Gynurincola endophyticus]|jgi:thiol-disulfide isomerase/thioredoxin|uniref:TlpA family protein disulfide reductase n=1 Tax=Gynurincola endophyticus TaxID=2479004 RepID=UPI000F8E1F35|nr:TlpA disulfide reductase family protein [Gynurincola endophyticus]
MKPFIIAGLSLLLSLSLSAQLKVGNKAPQIAAQTKEGVRFDFRAYEGKYLLIDVWASWCGPCLKAFPELKKLYKEYTSKKFDIIGVSIDNSAGQWQNTVEKHGLAWKQYHAPGNFKSPVVDAWGIDALPSTFLINPKGEIEMIDPSPKQLKKFLSKLK